MLVSPVSILASPVSLMGQHPAGSAHKDRSLIIHTLSGKEIAMKDLCREMLTSDSGQTSPLI